MTDAEIDRRFKESVFVVKCTFEEMFLLWEKFCNQTMYKTELSIYDWEQVGPGFCEIIGHVNKKPVCANVWWYKINGFMITCYEATSRMVDHEMLDKWMESKCNPKWDKGTRQAHTDAANFADVLHYIRYEDKR